MKKPLIIGVIVLVTILVGGGATLLALSFFDNSKKPSPSVSAEETAKNKASDANAAAQKLLGDIAKQGNTKESEDKAREAVAKFNEASEQYKKAGDTHESVSAQANAASLQYQIASQEAARKQQEAEDAKKQAEYDAVKAAMQQANQQQ